MGATLTPLICFTQHNFLFVGIFAGAYAFSRYRFMGIVSFFWLLTNRMSPPAVFLFLSFTQLLVFDTLWGVALAHTLFNIPLCVWILEGFMSGIPKEIDEMSYLEGHSFPSFFIKLFLPLIRSGIGVAAFFCFMFSWVELLLARTLTSVHAKPIVAVMTRTRGAAGQTGALWQPLEFNDCSRPFVI